MKKILSSFPIMLAVFIVIIFLVFFFSPLDVYDGLVSTEVVEYEFKATLGQLLGTNVQANEEVMMDNFSLNWRGMLFLITVHLVLPAGLASFIKRRFN